MFAAAKVPAVAADVELAAVVGDEDGEGVFPLAVGLEGIDDLSDTVVEVLDERDEFGAFGSDAIFTGLHFFKPIFGRLDRGVGRVVGQVEEERVFGILAGGEVVLGPVGKNVSGVAFGIHLFFIEAHVVLSVTAVLVVVVHHIAEEAVEVIETAGVGVGFVIEPEVPFSDGGGVVSERLESLGKRNGGRGKIAPVVLGFGADDPGNADELLVASRQERSAGG